MSSKDTYWLCRTQGAQTEGPFSLGQLQRMYEAGSVTAEAVVCEEGTKEWVWLEGLLGARVQAAAVPVAGGRDDVTVRVMTVEESLRRRDTEVAERIGTAVNVVTCLICLVGLVPVLGLSAYVVWGGWALIASVMCIVQMAKGLVGQGVSNLVGVWILAPLVITGLQFVGLSWAADRGREMREELEAEMAAAAMEAEISPAEMTRPQEPARPVEMTPQQRREEQARELVMRSRRGAVITATRAQEEPDGWKIWVTFDHAGVEDVWRIRFLYDKVHEVYSDREGDLKVE